MYEAVHALPGSLDDASDALAAADGSDETGGATTAARWTKTAAEYGFSGVVVRTRGADYDAERLAAKHGIDVVRGLEIRADSRDAASGAVGQARGECEVLLVRGGSPQVNRFAVEQDRVDVLTRPFRKRGNVNHVLCNAAAEHGVAIEFDFGPVLREQGGERVKHVGRLRKLRELVADAGAPFVVSANPRTHLELRAPRDLVAVGEQVGFTADQVREGLARWGEIAERTRERRADDYVSPGVKRGRYEGGDT